MPLARKIAVIGVPSSAGAFAIGQGESFVSRRPVPLQRSCDPSTGISSSVGGDPAVTIPRMDADRGSDDPAAFEADVIHQQVAALTDASTQRHRLVPGSTEYEAALEVEEHIAEHVWRLATDLHAGGTDRSRSGPDVD